MTDPVPADHEQPSGEQPDGSIWQPLDGSAPVRPQPEASPLTFTKPEPRPLTFPASPQAAQEALGRPASSPDGRPVFVLAGWGSRFGGYLLDNIAFGIAALCLTLPLAIALGMTVEEAVLFLSGNDFRVPDSVTDPAFAWALFGVQVLAPPIVAAVFLARWGGQTPGKRIVGVQVVPEEGGPITLGRALRRELVAKTFILMPLVLVTFGLAFLANYLWPLRDPQNRAGHDFFAHTRVVVGRGAGR